MRSSPCVHFNARTAIQVLPVVAAHAGRKHLPCLHRRCLPREVLSRPAHEGYVPPVGAGRASELQDPVATGKGAGNTLPPSPSPCGSHGKAAYLSRPAGAAARSWQIRDTRHINRQYSPYSVLGYPDIKQAPDFYCVGIVSWWVEEQRNVSRHTGIFLPTSSHFSEC